MPTGCLWAPIGYPRDAYGVPIGYRRECLWATYGGAYGVPIGYPWTAYGVPMGVPIGYLLGIL